MMLIRWHRIIPLRVVVLEFGRISSWFWLRIYIHIYIYIHILYIYIVYIYVCATLNQVYFQTFPRGPFPTLNRAPHSLCCASDVRMRQFCVVIYLFNIFATDISDSHFSLINFGLSTNNVREKCSFEIVIRRVLLILDIVNKVEERLARHGACDVARLLDACMLRCAGLPNK